MNLDCQKTNPGALNVLSKGIYADNVHSEGMGEVVPSCPPTVVSFSQVL